jgi:site-specific recombinase XerD
VDGTGVPGAPRRDRRGGHGKIRRGRGPQLKERDGHWHIVGTLRIAKRSIRLRESTGLSATAANRDDAQILLEERIREIRKEVIHGIKPSVPVAVAADHYLSRKRRRPLGATTVRIIKEITCRFQLRKLSNIDELEWLALVEKRQAGNSAETRERYLNSVLGFLAWCQKKPRQWLRELPTFDRDQEARNPHTRKRRRIAELTPDFIAFLLDHAAPHLRAQIAVEASTGARVSSILHGCRLCDAILAPDREQIIFHDTKNGEDVTSSLHPFAAEELRRYLKHRGRLQDREGALFLTDRGNPYRGRENKTAFNSMKRRAIKSFRRQLASELRRLRSAGHRTLAWEVLVSGRDRLIVMRDVTQHWFRHNLATQILANKGDVRVAMDQAGWLDVRSVMAYAHDVPQHRRAVVNLLPLPDTSLTREGDATANKDDKSGT